MSFGFVKVAAAIPSIKVADCDYNVAQIELLIERAAKNKVTVVAFPELSITAYSCADLFSQQLLLTKARQTLNTLVEHTSSQSIISVVGMPLSVGINTYNVAVVFSLGKILGVVPKSHLPNYNEFYEARWFAPASKVDRQQIELCGQTVPFGVDLLFERGELCFGVEICEDLWVSIPPSTMQALSGANLLINLSASNEMVGKHDYLCSLIKIQSSRNIAAYLYSSAGFGESSTDLLFAGNAIVAESGTIVAENERFSFDPQLIISDIDIEKLQSLRRHSNTFTGTNNTPIFRHISLPFHIDSDEYTLSREINPLPFIPHNDTELDSVCQEIFNIQTGALAQRISHTQAKTAVVGISGGLDSTLALLVCVRTFDKMGLDRKGILGVTMPGFGTTNRTYNNALTLMRGLGIQIREISIAEACQQHFKDIGLDPQDRSATYENAQARERTQILMDIANQTGGFVIGTGDLSELALGWATYNGDHMSMYGVNAGIPKTLIRHLVSWIAKSKGVENVCECLLDIVDTPISPELLPASASGQITQKTEDLVGPYELHDFFLYYFIKYGFRPSKIAFLASHAFVGTYDKPTIKQWLRVFVRRFFSQQFKRSALPDGPKIGSINLSPRGDWKMPSDACAEMWLNDIEDL